MEIKFQTENECSSPITKASIQWNGVKNRFGDLADHWSELSSRLLKGVSICTNESRLSMSGVALDKPFSIRLDIQVREEVAYGLCTVLTPDRISNHQIVIDSFLLDRSGYFYNNVGEKILDTNPAAAWIILCNVIYAVISSRV